MENEQIGELFEIVENQNIRALLLIVGSRSTERISDLYRLWQKKNPKNKSEILWCFKKTNGTDSIPISGAKKYIKSEKIKIRYCYYEETKKILGNTFGFCILQDLENLSPNNMARIFETIEGGGIIVLMIRTLNHVKNLKNLALSVHNNYKSSINENFTGRFLQHFLFSLFECKTFLPLTDNLQIIQEFKKIHSTMYLDLKKKKGFSLNNSTLYERLIDSLQKLEPIHSLMIKTKTLDQAKALLILIEALSNKKFLSTVLLSSPRGRGKSASLGLAVASAISYGYGNIFVSAPDPENLRSFYAFLFLGFNCLNYKEGHDFRIVQNSRSRYIEVIEFNLTHRQRISFVFPNEIPLIKEQIELLVIDEAAAIGEELVNSLNGSFSVFLGTTSSGYEGSGKYLALKLVKKIKENYLQSSDFSFVKTKRIVKEIELQEPIRYSKGDPVENWLNDLFVLDPRIETILLEGCPFPSKCELYLVDRGVLFSHNQISKMFLQKIISLFSASHYRNSPNDIQLLCDSPSHRIFILLEKSLRRLKFVPEVLCCLQISYEGQISKKFMKKNLNNSNGVKGDLTSWVLSKENFDPSFGELPGVRVVRITTHPDVKNLGYGSKTVREFFEFCDIKRTKKINQSQTKFMNETELPKRKKSVNSMLISISSRIPPNLAYLSVSFSISLNSLSFWTKNGLKIVCIKNTQLGKIGKNTVLMVKKLGNQKGLPKSWLNVFRLNCSRKFSNLSYSRDLPFSVEEALVIFKNIFSKNQVKKEQLGKLKFLFSALEIKKLRSFSIGVEQEFYRITDLIPLVSKVCLFTNFHLNLFNVFEISLCIATGILNKTTEELKKLFSLRYYNIINSFEGIIRKILMLLD